MVAVLFGITTDGIGIFFSFVISSLIDAGAFVWVEFRKSLLMNLSGS